MLPLFGSFFMVVSCHDEVVTHSQGTTLSSIATDLPNEVQARLDGLKKDHPDISFIVYEIDRKQAEDLEQKLKVNDIDPATVAFMEVFKDRMDQHGKIRSFVIVGYNDNVGGRIEQPDPGNR